MVSLAVVTEYQRTTKEKGGQQYSKTAAGEKLLVIC